MIGLGILVFGGIGKAVVQGCSFFNTFGTSRAVINSAIDLDVADSSFTLGIVTEGCGAIYATSINIRNSYFYSNRIAKAASLYQGAGGHICVHVSNIIIIFKTN